MQTLIRPLRQDDEPFLWDMLYYAAHMQDDGEITTDAAKHTPELQKYVQGWGRETDVGVLALHPFNQRPLGAAWVRVLIEEKKMSRLIPDGTPELAIAVLPDHIRQGIGAQLMKHVLEAARNTEPSMPLRHFHSRN